jgi:hypothetical protein
MEACGCGEEQIPWMLARFGLLGTAGLALATLLVMLLTGWLLATAVWLVRRRRGGTAATDGAGAAEGTGAVDSRGPVASEAPETPFGGFTWRAEEP